MRSQRFFTFLECMFLVLLSFATYAWILNNNLIGGDLPQLLVRFRAADAATIFTEGLWGPTSTFYRPLAGLIYHFEALQYGLDGTSYQFTNVLVHSLVAVFTYVLMRLSRSGQRRAALFAGVLVALHPGAVEVVPNISHRMDSLATLCTLLTLSLFLSSLRFGRSVRAYLVYGLALATFASAILIKEIGFMMVLILPIAAFLLSPSPTWRVGARRALVATLPFVLTGIVLFVWRAFVVSGALLSRVPNPFADPGGRLKEIASRLISYIWFLLFPQSSNPGDFDKNQLAQFLAGNSVTLVLAVMLLLLLFVYAVRQVSVRKSSKSKWRLTFDEKYLLWLAIWIFLPFCLFAFTIFHYHYIYFVLPPFAMCFAFLSDKALLQIFKDSQPVRASPVPGWSKPALSLVVALSGGIVALVLFAQFVYFSPLLYQYPPFLESSSLVRKLLRDFDRDAQSMRTAPRITVENWPIRLLQGNRPGARVRVLEAAFIPAYYRLATYDTEAKWCIVSSVESANYELPFTTQTLPNGEYRITFQAPPASPRTEYPECCTSDYCK